MALKDTPLGVAGQIANLNPVDSYTFPAMVDIPFGRLVTRGAEGATLGGGADPLGVSGRTMMIGMPLSGTGSTQAQWPAKGSLGVTVIRDGYVFVNVVDGCEAGGDVYASDTTGEFRGTTEAGFTKVEGAKFQSACVAGEVAILRVKF